MLCIILWLSHRHRHAAPAIPLTVAIATVEQKNIPIYISALGNVTATYTVTLKTQINGLLMDVLFREGQQVSKGQLLAKIDDRLLQAQLLKYQGQLIRDQALLENALIDQKRYQILWKQDSIAQQTLATQNSLVKQYQGTVTMDQGMIDSTKVNLLYCNITSPIDGRVGLRLVDPGNFVQTSDANGIAILTTLNPITVIFSIPEDDIQHIIHGAQVNKQLQVDAYDRTETHLLARGGIVRIDNLVNTQTGTLKLRAKFTNTEGKLFPNQFVNIKLLVNTLQHAIVVPTAAIQHNAHGDFVYVVTAQSTVQAIPVKTGVTYHQATVIHKGLNPGQKVVIQGIDQLTDGALVTLS